MSKKTAIVLFNLGGPDSRETIKPFLFNFFMDKNIIRLPVLFRFALAKLISIRRSKNEAGDSYGLLGNKSPLLENSRAQCAALEAALNSGEAADSDSGGSGSAVREFKSFICMRYWHPMAEEVVEQVRAWGADEIVLLPLYPQFSTTTTWSSLGVWNTAAKAAGFDLPASMICCYPKNDGFIRASAENILAQYRAARAAGHDAADIRFLFSAHGLPESVITDGDPYQWQCEETARLIVEDLKGDLGMDNPDWAICYQSRVGPKKWIGPSLDEEIERAAADGKAVVIYPHAFTQEHVETLVELDIEYRHKADDLGLCGYYRAATVDTHPAFIDGLAALVRAHVGRGDVVAAEGGSCLCGDGFRRCCMKATGGITSKAA